MNDILANLTELLNWATIHSAGLLATGGAVLAAVLLLLIRRAVRTGRAAGLAVGVAVLLATAFSAEGMYEVATEQLGLPWYLAAGLFVVAEAAMLASAVRADKMHKATGSLGMHGRFVWTIAAAAGVVVCLNGRNLVEVLLRLLMPLLVAGLWWMGYQTQATRERAADAITWTLSPRRILVRLGLAEAGERDVIAVSRDRHTDRLTVTAHRVHHGWKVLRPIRSARLRRLALRADDAMVSEVRARITRVHEIERLTAPAVLVDGPVSADATAEAVVTPVATRAPARKALPPAAVKVAKLRAQDPAMPQDTVAKRTGLAVRTVQRHWNVATPGEQPVINGTEVLQTA